MKKWAWIAPLAVLIDQAVKFAVSRMTFPSGMDLAPLIPGVLRLTYTENTGMAFSLFSGRPWLLGAASAACILAGWAVLRQYRLGTLSRIGAMLMLGGAVGNMLDRFFRGYVVDMFELLFVRFAVFNVADAALTVGAGLMMIALLCCPKDWSKKNGSTSDDLHG